MNIRIITVLFIRPRLLSLTLRLQFHHPLLETFILSSESYNLMKQIYWSSANLLFNHRSQEKRAYDIKYGCKYKIDPVALPQAPVLESTPQHGFLI